MIYIPEFPELINDAGQAAEVFYSLLKPGGIIAVADLDPDNGESHGPEMIMHNGFFRANLIGIFRKAGFINIQIDNVATLTKASSKTGELKESPIFLMIAHKNK